MKCRLCGDDGIEYGNEVKIIKGFHKGRMGKVIDEGRTCGVYRVKFSDGEYANDVPGWQMEKIEV
jgi:hypothetical protein